MIPPKLTWLDGAIATALGVPSLWSWTSRRGCSRARSHFPSKSSPRSPSPPVVFGLLRPMTMYNQPTPNAAPAEKKTEAATTSLIPAWHPNFRNFAALPDIKPVRTAFFVNGIAALVAFALLVFLGQREYALHSINTQIATRQHEIDRDKPGSEQAVVLYKKFQDEEKKLQGRRHLRAEIEARHLGVA